jgi:hypothetical protein
VEFSLTILVIYGIIHLFSGWRLSKIRQVMRGAPRAHSQGKDVQNREKSRSVQMESDLYALGREYARRSYELYEIIADCRTRMRKAGACGNQAEALRNAQLLLLHEEQLSDMVDIARHLLLRGAPPAGGTKTKGC